LAFYLYFFNKSLQLHPGTTRVSPFNVTRKLIQLRLRVSKRRNIIKLPFYGCLCLPVHRGFKIFNFRKKTVIKSFLTNIHLAAVANEIEAVQGASQLNFAPKLRGWSIDDRWYQEDFINGSPYYANPRSETKISITIYYREILTCLKKMFLLKQAQEITLHAYVERIFQNINQRLSAISSIKQTERNAIHRFLEVNNKALLSKKNIEIPLVFSHGDFSLINMLKTKNGIKVIDWEGANLRNPLHDLFNYFFTESYYNRLSPKILPETIKAVGDLKSSVKAELPKIANSLEPLSEIYRKLYYLERLCMLFMRDESKKVQRVINNSIELFDSFEKCNDSK
jgi:hypothetical protein